MKKNAKKAVVLNNFSSPYISEAIIILRDYDPLLEGKVIAEAERVVAEYIKRNERMASPPVHSVKKRHRLGIFFIVIALLAAAAVIYKLTV